MCFARLNSNFLGLVENMISSHCDRSSFSGKIAVVTGGLSGIGDAIARQFICNDAAAVIRLDVSAPSAELVDEAEPAIRCNIADAHEVNRAVEAIIARYGKIDVLVNSAGISKIVPFLDTPLELYDRIMSVNLTGSFLTCQAVARHMVSAGGGCILNIGSVSGILGNAGRSAYGSSKAALVQMSNVMAGELGQHNVRVNVLAPGPVKTPMAKDAHSEATIQAWHSRVPMHRYGTPEEMAGVAVFLCSDEANYITGSVISVDGGFVSAGLLQC